MSSCDLSVVVEMTTGDITGACDVQARLRSWISEAAALAPRRVEFLLVGPEPIQGAEALRATGPVRCLAVPGAGYYALKNAGANQAAGDLVLFTDADCRPGPGYLARLVEVFADGEVAAVAGRSLYDGTGFLTRLNTAQSFGDLHCPQLRPSMVLTHNVALRRSAYDRDPFGPFTARVGGDRYLVRTLQERGLVLRVVDDLVLHHEDVSYNLPGLVERHLRECIVPLGYGTEQQRVSYPFAALCTVLLRPALRLRRLLRAGWRNGIRPWHYPAALAVNLAYWAFDVVLVGFVLLVPSQRRRRLRFQFGG
jgi:glycosyltransferase involved in cell wall biosynthesis